MIVSSKAASDFVKGYRQAGGRATFISLSNTSNNDYVAGLGDQARGAIVMQVMPSPFSATTALANGGHTDYRLKNATWESCAAKMRELGQAGW